MQENNTEKEIEKWYITHMKSYFLYYVLASIFTIIFAYVFYVNINTHLLCLLCLYAFVPAFLVTILSFLLLRGYFLVFFGINSFLAPAIVTLFILFTLNMSAPSMGYVIYTNNLTAKCKIEVLDYKKGTPWFATKGCLLNEASKPVIQQFIKAGGSGMRWQNACQVLRFSSNNLVKLYDKVAVKNSSFDIEKSLKGEIAYATTTDEYIFVDKLQAFRRTASQNLSDFKSDVPGITADDVLNLCSVNHLKLGTYKVY